MTSDDDWIEEPVVIRRPEDKKLADAKDAEGWSRGFTAKTGKDGLQHVHIRKMRDDELNPEPTVIHHYHDEQPYQRTQTWGEWFAVAVAEAVASALNDVIEELKPHAANWWSTTAVPAMKGKAAQLLRKWGGRKTAKRARTTDSTPITAATEDDQGIAMTPDQYDQLAFMATDEFRARVVDALAKARVVDGMPAIVDQLEEIRELPPSQQAERVHEILVNDPAILEDLERQIPERVSDDPA